MVALVVSAGAKLDAQWYEIKGRQRAAKGMLSDARMLAALRGEV